MAIPVIVQTPAKKAPANLSLTAGDLIQSKSTNEVFMLAKTPGQHFLLQLSTGLLQKVDVVEFSSEWWTKLRHTNSLIVEAV